nr:putative serine/threonine/dual specificity protein kinase, catalytic domain-containing protein [Tanacetum cinerariifolium]
MSFVGIKSRVLIPETTFVDVESRVLIPETTFVGVESRVSSPETTFVDVESRIDIPSVCRVKQIDTEVKMLSRVRHGHLVSLIGYCNEFNEMLVVYEYISGGNLAKRLHKVDGKSIRTPLSWIERLKICIGAARALDYLHIGTRVKNIIIYRDVKKAKVSDLGLSKIGPIDQSYTHVSTDVKGSFGYLDLNYFMTRRLTRKFDVYSFGFLLLEILCGRPDVDPSLGDDELGTGGMGPTERKRRNIKRYN